MPYTLINYPSQIRDLPAQAKKIWIGAFNSTYAQYKNESKAFAIAWAAVKKAGWKKKSGEWVRWK